MVATVSSFCSPPPAPSCSLPHGMVGALRWPSCLAVMWRGRGVLKGVCS